MFPRCWDEGQPAAKSFDGWFAVRSMCLGWAGYGTGHFGSDLGCVFDRLPLDSGLGGRGCLRPTGQDSQRSWKPALTTAVTDVHGSGVSGLRDFKFHFKVLLGRDFRQK